MESRKIDVIREKIAALINSGDSDKYQQDMSCISQACQDNVTAQQLADLYQCIHKHGVAFGKSKTGGRAAGLGGFALMSGGAGTLVATGGAAAYPAVGAFLMGAGMFAGAVGFVKTDMDKRIGLMERELLLEINQDLLNNNQYDFFTIALLTHLKSIVTAKDSNLVFEIALLNDFIANQIPAYKNDLYGMCRTLTINFYRSLLTAPSFITPDASDLIQTLCQHMLAKADYGDYIKIQLSLILLHAKIRDENNKWERTKRNNILSYMIDNIDNNDLAADVMQSLLFDNDSDPAHIKAALEKAASLIQDARSLTVSDILKLSDDFSSWIATNADSAQSAPTSWSSLLRF